jgi:hypothetical protein
MAQYLADPPRRTFRDRDVVHFVRPAGGVVAAIAMSVDPAAIAAIARSPKG